MTCNRCKSPIVAGQKYHRTQQGSHHAMCSTPPLVWLDSRAGYLLVRGRTILGRVEHINGDWVSHGSGAEMDDVDLGKHGDSYVKAVEAVEKWAAKWQVSSFVIEQPFLVHGTSCKKAPHAPGISGYLHDAKDDGPYDVDGRNYCGRCHTALEEMR